MGETPRNPHDPATREPFRSREWAASLSLDELRAVTTAGDEWSETGVIPDGSILRTIDDGFANLGILRLTAVNDAWRELAKRLDGAAAPLPDTAAPDHEREPLPYEPSPCGVCGGPDQRHRTVDTQMERIIAGERIDEVAADHFGYHQAIEVGRAYPDEVVAMVAAWRDSYTVAFESWAASGAGVARPDTPPTDDDTLRVALGFVVECLGVGGNGEGWTLDDATKVAAVAAGDDRVTIRDEDWPRLASIMGEQWVADVRATDRRRGTVR